ncbi:MAG: CDP-diacylglycerol--glycerol-3-phosphate 3-phosphatidyltransferase [Cardiobacteriaceae bacterium]|nr:CDP-diacylglycerol--glycerol-3-phosphate 3-phosphatidyltransferase [Cardiobacteriaceae bacterium]
MERFRGWAMRLTLLRVWLIPLFVVTFYFHPESWNQWLAVGVYFIACISDFFDGYLARTLKEESAFGAFLDPVADKLMVAIVLIVILQARPEYWLMFCSIVIIGREIWISALREWLAGLGKRDVVAVSKMGKWKTTAQMFALGFLIYQKALWGIPIWGIGKALLILATVLTLHSMWIYTQAAMRYLKQ